MNAEQLAGALGGVRSGRQWKCKCICHNDRSPSMMIFDGREAVQVRCLAGCDQADLIGELKRRGLWGVEHRAERVQNSSARVQRSPTISHEAQRRFEQMIDYAQRLFNQALPCAGTPAQHYLERREIWNEARMIDDIRFSMRCPREHVLTPAIIVAMRDFKSGEITAVQRIFLTQDVHGNVIKDGKPMMLGRASGSAMQLQRLQDGELHICEGLETGLSLIAMGNGPMWSLGSCGAIRAFQVLPGVERLLIWADNDKAGNEAADACGARWKLAGRRVKIRSPSLEGQDAADVWRDRVGRV
jgi:hypothetical protein